MRGEKTGRGEEEEEERTDLNAVDLKAVGKSGQQWTTVDNRGA